MMSVSRAAGSDRPGQVLHMSNMTKTVKSLLTSAS